MEILGNEKRSKKGTLFLCKKCDFECSKQSKWDRHLATQKHLYGHDGNKIVLFTNKKGPDLKCSCGQYYNSYSGLWKHKQKCNIQETVLEVSSDKSCDKPIDKTPIDTCKMYNTEELENVDIDGFSMNNEGLTKMLLENIRENREFQKQMFELMKDNMVMGTTTTNINSHNKTMNNNFNLNFFLNETCKDAMDIDDFIDYVKVQLNDFENFGNVGYPKAVGDIIVRNLNELDVKIRPIHCSDLKREVLHVKHDGVWHNDVTRTFIKRSIMYVANKNIKQIPKWQDLNPESRDCFTKTFDKYNKLCRASLGPATDAEEADFLRKITSIVAKEVVIDKKKKY